MNRFCRFFSLLLLVSIAGNVTAQTLFTYGGKPVSKEEFLKAYNKNNTTEKRDEKSLREYLDLYTKFKLKVQAAYDLRLDTLPSQKAELQNFRMQLVQNYLNDENSLNNLVDEAFDRSQKDIRISHIFIPANVKDSPAVIQRAKQKIQEAYKQLQAGKDFGQVAMTYSADPSVTVNKGDIGFITVFTLPYELESLAYNTPLGKFSAPYKSKTGFHIFKKTAERKAFGKMKVAQILLSFPADADEATRRDFKQRADSLYEAAIKGADFGALAARFSGDNFSYQTKGEIPEFSAGRYTPAFETAAFSLGKDGDISKPVLTEFGYHIIKRISRTPIPADKKDKEYRNQLREQVSNDDRIDVSKKILAQKILKLSDFKKAAFNAKDLWAYTDSTLNNRPVPASTSIRPNTILFSFKDQKVTASDWIAFRKSTIGVDRITGGKTDQELLDSYVDLAAMEYYKNHLEMFNKDFAFQMKEFKEGNLLFEIMQRNVWDKAASDSIGLRNYYNAHKNNYWWQNSVSGVLFTSSSEKNGIDLKQKLQRNIKDWRSIAETYEGGVIADSGRFEVEQLALPANYQFQAKTFTPFIKNQTDTSVSFVYILQHFPEKAARSFEEARGYVINDYQAYLEEQWLAELKKKYPIKVNQEMFRTMMK